MNGIDISWWQRDNYKYLIDKYATDFVISRATFDFGVDSTCDPIYQYAKSKGLQRGVYFFPLTESSDPETSADWCVTQVEGYLHHAIMFLDWEGTVGTDVSKIWWAKRWLDRFTEKSGVKPVIYMNTSTVRSYDWSSVANADYGLWLADYGVNDGFDHGVPEIPYWSIICCHQYTSLGDNGAGLDKDVFFGDVTAWRAYAGADNSSVNPSKPIENDLDQYTDEQLADMVLDNKFGIDEERKNKLGNRYDSAQAIVNRKVEEKLKSRNQYYTIQAGDTLSGISEKFGTPINQLCSWNNIANPDVIYAGDRIRVK
jgi:LysM repeat protein